MALPLMTSSISSCMNLHNFLLRQLHRHTLSKKGKLDLCSFSGQQAGLAPARCSNKIATRGTLQSRVSIIDAHLASILAFSAASWSCSCLAASIWFCIGTEMDFSFN